MLATSFSSSKSLSSSKSWLILLPFLFKPLISLYVLPLCLNWSVTFPESAPSRSKYSKLLPIESPNNAKSTAYMTLDLPQPKPPTRQLNPRVKGTVDFTWLRMFSSCTISIFIWRAPRLLVWLCHPVFELKAQLSWRHLSRFFLLHLCHNVPKRFAWNTQKLWFWSL